MLIIVSSVWLSVDRMASSIAVSSATCVDCTHAFGTQRLMFLRSSLPNTTLAAACGGRLGRVRVAPPICTVTASPGVGLVLLLFIAGRGRSRGSPILVVSVRSPWPNDSISWGSWNTMAPSVASNRSRICLSLVRLGSHSGCRRSSFAFAPSAHACGFLHPLVLSSSQASHRHVALFS
jgi:hypothetical protein